MTSAPEQGKSRTLAIRVIYAALLTLKERGGELPLAEIRSELSKRLHFDEWESAIYESNGLPRWVTMLHFFSIDCVKAGFLIKKRGVWFLTPEGEKALALGDKGLLDAAGVAYRKWRAANPKETAVEVQEAEPAGPDIGSRSAEATLDDIQARALEGLRAFVKTKNPYEFQDLAAALLRVMGYYTPFVAPKGKDGGMDIVAYRDPLGTLTPRVKVQIKHRESPATVQELRQLVGIISGDGEVGLFISTGGFTPDARSTARSSHIHVELVDLDRFLDLWREFYPKMSDEDRALLPLIPVHFLAPNP